MPSVLSESFSGPSNFGSNEPSDTESSDKLLDALVLTVMAAESLDESGTVLQHHFDQG